MHHTPETVKNTLDEISATNRARYQAAMDNAAAIRAGRPPLSNRGVITPTLTPPTLSIDFITFSAPSASLERMKNLLDDENEWEEIKYAHYGYSITYQTGKYRIFAEGHDEKMGICVQMSGQACRQYEGSPWFNGWEQFFGLVRETECVNFTRIDVAADDRTGVVTPEVLDGLLRAGHAVTMAKTLGWREDRTVAGHGLGATLYIGSTKSETFVRAYDKNGEQGINDPAEPWTRVEVVSKGEKAELIVDVIIKQRLSAVAGVIARLIDIKDASASSRIERCPTASWWAAWLSGWDKIRLTCIAVKATIEKCISWLKEAVAPSLAAVLHAYRHNPKILMDIIKVGEGSLKKKHVNMIQDFQSKRDTRYLDDIQDYLYKAGCGV